MQSSCFVFYKFWSPKKLLINAQLLDASKKGSIEDIVNTVVWSTPTMPNQHQFQAWGTPNSLPPWLVLGQPPSRSTNNDSGLGGLPIALLIGLSSGDPHLCLCELNQPTNSPLHAQYTNDAQFGLCPPYECEHSYDPHPKGSLATA